MRMRKFDDRCGMEGMHVTTKRFTTNYEEWDRAMVEVEIGQSIER